jgi:hypothetical protein
MKSLRQQRKVNEATQIPRSVAKHPRTVKACQADGMTRIVGVALLRWIKTHPECREIQSGGN